MTKLICVKAIFLLLLLTLCSSKSLTGKSCTTAEIMEEGIQKLAMANNRLALNLHGKFSEGTQQNVFFSPFSISSALAMLFHGARSETAEELKEVLGYNKASLESEQVHSIFQQFLTEVLPSNDEKAYVLRSANAILVDKNMDLIDNYREEIQRLYEASVQDVDFSKDAATIIDEVNGWVNSKTNGKISKILNKLDRSTILLLLNAVYFKGTWKKQFDPKRTITQTFYNGGLESAAKNTKMMHTTDKFLYANDFECEALELPYKGENISMLILLPNARDGLASLENSLTVEKLTIMRQNLHKTKVDVSFPKFKLEYNRDVSQDLQSLGAGKMFAPSADFSGMTTQNNTFVSQVLHKAFIEVNEEGSEAAAVTAIIMNRISPMLQTRPPRFVADHPFMFAIIDKRNDMILFLGHVNNL